MNQSRGRTKSSSSPIITVGMHRSGTSYVAKSLREAGVGLGGSLLEPSPFNREGYFEDKRIIRLHDELLSRRGGSWRSVRLAEKSFSHTDDEIRMARRAVRPLMQETGTPWGWKDPRTTLFLDLWASVFPDARFLFVFRSPQDVVWSLYRRGDISVTPLPGVGRWLRGLGLWRAYNERLLRFAERHLDNVAAVLEFPTDLATGDISAFIQEVFCDDSRTTVFGEALRAFYDPDLTTEAPLMVAIGTRLHAGVQNTLRRLRRLKATKRYPSQGAESRRGGSQGQA